MVQSLKGLRILDGLAVRLYFSSWALQFSVFRFKDSQGQESVGQIRQTESLNIGIERDLDIKFQALGIV